MPFCRHFECIFVDEKWNVMIKISLKFVPEGSIRSGDFDKFQCIKLAEMSTGPYGPVDCKEHWSVKKATGP